LKEYAHKPGTINPIMQQEEKAILLSVDRAKSSSNNSQTLGRNGEIPLIDFLNRYLPSTLKAASGHFITKNGALSPQIDVLILDSRYPLLSQNPDNSVLAMAHSVIDAIEIKTNITTNDIKKISANSKLIMEILAEEEIIGCYPKWGTVMTSAIAYQCAQRLNTLEKTYIESSAPKLSNTDITILRYPAKDLESRSGVGGTLHFEQLDKENVPLVSVNNRDKYIKHDCLFMSISSHTPLSDFYYNLVQNAYYTLGDRNFTFHDIGNDFNNYMTWATAKWQDF